MNSAQLSQVNNAMKNMKEGVNSAQKANGQITAGANALQNNQPGLANRNATNASANMKRAVSKIENARNAMANLANKTNNKKAAASAQAMTNTLKSAEKLLYTDMFAHAAKAFKLMAESTTANTVNIRKN